MCRLRSHKVTIKLPRKLLVLAMRPLRGLRVLLGRDTSVTLLKAFISEPPPKSILSINKRAV